MIFFDNNEFTEYRIDDDGLLKYTNFFVKQRELRYLLYGIDCDKISDISQINYHSIIYILFNFTFLFMYLWSKNDKFLCNINEFSSNAKRVFHCFQSVFAKEKVNIDIALYVFTEAWCDVKMFKHKSCFASMFDIGTAEKDISINDYRTLIESWKVGYKTAIQNIDTLKKAYVFLLHLISPILKSIEIYLLDDGSVKVIRTEKDDTPFPVKSEFNFNDVIIYYEETRSYYFLKSFEKSKNESAPYIFCYNDFLEKEELQLEKKISERNRNLLNLDKTVLNKKPLNQDMLARKFFTIDYKYIQRLTFSICDCISVEKKRELFFCYHEKFPSIFIQEKKFLSERHTANILDCDLAGLISKSSNWDNYIVLLLLEDGLYNLLERVITSKQNFDDLCKALSMRFDNASYKEMQDVYLLKMKNLDLSIRRQKIDSTVNDYLEILKKHEIELMIDVIVDTITDETKNKTKNVHHVYYAETISSQLRDFENAILKKSSIEKVMYFNKLIEKNLRFIICFYCGLLAYAKKFFSITSTSNKLYVVNDSIEAFKKEAIVTVSRVEKKSFGQLVSFMNALTNDLSFNQEKRSHLKNVIGREYILDSKLFNDILNYKTINTSFMKNNSDSLVNLTNLEKHYSGKPKEEANYYLDELLVAAKHLLLFFIYNTDFKQSKDRTQYSDVLEDPVYPYVMKYIKKSETGKGFFVSNYQIKFSDDRGKDSINVLTEQTYEINEYYYCIPNMFFTTKNWWVNPFLIRCRDFDQILLQTDSATLDICENENY